MKRGGGGGGGHEWEKGVSSRLFSSSSSPIDAYKAGYDFLIGFILEKLLAYLGLFSFMFLMF